MKRRIFTLLVAAAPLIFSVPLWATGKGEGGSGKIKATLITMDSIDEHWLKVKAGAQAKADELGNVALTFNAPPGKVDAAIQLQMVEDAITKKSDIILLAPLNKDALSPGVEKAKKAGIKVIIIDSAVSAQDYDAFFSTDNGAAARTAADTLAGLIGGRGKVAIVNAQAGAGTTMTRENDFKDQIAANYPGITVVGTQYSDGDKTKALNIALDFITANPDLAGFYACNEGSTVGVGNAVDQKGLAGKVKVVGFDWSADTKSLVERGILQASMVQNPYEMGYQGLQAGVDAQKGETISPKDRDTGVTVATKDNADSIK
ncbi:MAG: ABC transporter substrate-binding protein [Spirochaetaceae bacterium]|jgi:ribose transport system substrate-binding protein|nr:ABC transporter substrate-binding protein [Spirochaetaceae bacterium]